MNDLHRATSLLLQASRVELERQQVAVVEQVPLETAVVVQLVLEGEEVVVVQLVLEREEEEEVVVQLFLEQEVVEGQLVPGTL